MLAADVGREQCGAHCKPADVLAREEVVRRRVLIPGVVKAHAENDEEVDGDNEGVHWNREYSLPDREHIGLVVFAHGSRVTAANDAVRAVAREASLRAGMPSYRTAFLELSDPTLAEAVSQLEAEGIRHVLVTPYFLTMGRHLTEDLPRLLADVRSEHPGMTVEASPPLDGHPDLAGILASRARSMLQAGEDSVTDAVGP